jgi:energy-coupling factor transporter ATP-binding protein EcfA2
MHITHVETNAKVGADVEIGPKTLIIGPNGSGKSTIVNAVELALSGRVSDIAGRTDVAREADVMALAPPGDSMLLASVTFSDDGVAQYRTEGSTAKAKKATRVTHGPAEHDEVLPIRTLKDALLGSAATARKFLLGKIAGEVTRDEIAELFPEELRAEWTKQVKTVAKTVAAPDALLAVIEQAGTAQREAAARAKSAHEAAKMIGGGRAAPPSKKELEAASQARQAASDAALKLAQAADLASWLTRTRAQFEEACREAEEASTTLAMRSAELANTDVPTPPHPAFPAIADVMAASIEAGGDCLACGGAKITKADLAYVRGELGDYETKRLAYQRLEADVRNRKVSTTAAIDRVERLEDDLSRGTPAGELPAMTLEEARAAAAAADTEYSNMRAAADAWATAKKAESAATAAEAEVEQWKAFKAACESAVGMVLGRAVAAFSRQVQAYLPAGDVFALRLIDGDREVVQFGLLRGEHLETALSGAEWARVITAMASACTPADRFAILIPEERAFDPDTLSQVLTAFGSAPHQVILCSPIEPTTVPDGWTVVHRGSWSVRWPG